MNKIITMYIRCLTSDLPREWLQSLPWAEYCHYSAHQASLWTSPFHLVYGHDPPLVHSYALGDAKLPVVHRQLLVRDEFLTEIRDWLEQAQQRYKFFYDEHHRDIMFMVGQWVWLCIIHKPVTSLNVANHSKLGPKFYGLFQVPERIGCVAYQL
jgi:hypothetical protein